ncbi:MAG: hypothetical protein ABIV51_03085 [Saprospiraceae bacterium]
MISFSFGIKAQSSQCNPSCKIVERLLTEKLFYTPQLDFSFADTIIIMDITNTLNSCNKVFTVNLEQSLSKSYSYEGVTYKSKLQKTILIRTQDVLPYPLIGSWDNNKEYSENYKNYLILERFEEFGNLILIKLFKVLSNHKIILSYRYTDEKLELIDFEVGQY